MSAVEFLLWGICIANYNMFSLVAMLNILFGQQLVDFVFVVFSSYAESFSCYLLLHWLCQTLF